MRLACYGTACSGSRTGQQGLVATAPRRSPAWLPVATGIVLTVVSHLVRDRFVIQPQVNTNEHKYSSVSPGEADSCHARAQAPDGSASQDRPPREAPET